MSEALNAQRNKSVDLSSSTRNIYNSGKGLEMSKLFPDPMIYNEIIKSKYKNLNDKNVLMVGDTEADINFARNANISSCWAEYGYGNVDNCLKLKPDFQISSFDLLMKI